MTIRNADDIHKKEDFPLIVLNLEDVGGDTSLQNELIKVLNSVQSRIYLLYCQWVEGDSIDPISLIEQTNNSKMLQDEI